ncbi:hypothetical protein B0H17DRAFT_1005151 [Mycena rosella]|uniref:NAD(P)-binding protein n=1 Tax=Mycena rosella TaxID=1033263 RepID=A0AAD7DW63_MYCRO|nr:hypothetical protein B0H17DRAFT_1005151 [Mycena rosella]
MQLSFWQFFKDQIRTPPAVVTADLTGQTVIVLGANTGIGFQATLHFAKMNPGRLILACRSESKGQAALDKLKAQTGCMTAELWLVDLADFASVRRFADKLEQDGGRVDILVENAAVAAYTYSATQDGWESSLQINYLASALLALLVLPRMLQTAQDHATTPRIVAVTSGLHYWHTLDKRLTDDPALLRTLGSAEYCTPAKMSDTYIVTKLFNIFFVRALTARLAPATPLVVNAVCPGYCYSELRRSFSGLRAVVDFLMERALAFTSEQGSRQLVFGAVARRDNPEAMRAAYISLSRVVEPSDYVLSTEGMKMQDRLWTEMVEILGKVDPRINTIVKRYLA